MSRTRYDRLAFDLGPENKFRRGRFASPHMNRSIIYTALPDIPLVQSGDDICAIIAAGLARAEIVLQNGDVIVIAQKIISKSENRYVNLMIWFPQPKLTNSLLSPARTRGMSKQSLRKHLRSCAPRKMS
jgi:hypothetical protein